MMRRVVAVLAITVLAAGLVPSAAAHADVPPVAFSGVPEAHGGSGFEVTVTYGVGDHPTSFRRVPDEVTVANGTLGGVRRLARTGPDRNKAWVLTVAPSPGDADVTVEVRGVSVTVPHTAPSAVVLPADASFVFVHDSKFLAEGGTVSVAYVAADPTGGWSCANSGASDNADVSGTDSGTAWTLAAAQDADTLWEDAAFTVTRTCAKTGEPDVVNADAVALRVMDDEPAFHFALDALTVAEGGSEIVGYTMTRPGGGYECSGGFSSDNSDVYHSSAVVRQVTVYAAQDGDSDDDTAAFAFAATCTKAGEPDKTYSDSIAVTVTDDDPPPVQSGTQKGIIPDLDLGSRAGLLGNNNIIVNHDNDQGDGDPPSGASVAFDADTLTVTEGHSEEVGVSIGCPDAGWARTLAESVTGSEDVTASLGIFGDAVTVAAAPDADRSDDTAAYTLTVICAKTGETDVTASATLTVTVTDTPPPVALRPSVNLGNKGAGLLTDRTIITPDPPTPGSVSFDDDVIIVHEGSSKSAGYTLTEPGGGGWTCAAAAVSGNSDITATIDTANSEADIAAAQDRDHYNDAALLTLTFTCTKTGQNDDVFSDTLSIAVEDDDEPAVALGSGNSPAGVEFDSDTVTIDEGGSGSVGYTLVEPGGPWWCYRSEYRGGSSDISVWLGTTKVHISAAHDRDHIDDTLTYKVTLFCSTHGGGERVYRDALTIKVTDDDDYQALVLEGNGGVCGRSMTAKRMILSKLDEGDCTTVTDTQLAGMNGWLHPGCFGDGFKAGDFAGMGNIDRIQAMSNPNTGRSRGIQTLPEGLFDDLSDLEWMNLSDNPIESFPDGIFEHLDNLEVLHLNGLYDPVDDDDDPCELRTNFLYVMTDARGWRKDRPPRQVPNVFTADTFRGMDSLYKLDLAHNYIPSLPSGGMFDGLTNLQLLWLAYSRIETLPGDLFKGAPAMDCVTLNDNNIQTLPEGLFVGLTRLQEMNLANNPGTPFTLTLELVGKPGGAAVKVLEGAPFPLTGTLSATGGTIGSTAFRIERGDTESATFTIDPDTVGGKVTVSIDSARLNATFEAMHGNPSNTTCRNAGWVQSWTPSVSKEI